MEETVRKKKRIVFQSIIIGIVILLMIGITILAWPYVIKLKNVTYREHFIAKMQKMGFGGAVILVLITAIQVIFAFIPGEPVELLAGVMYGPWFGLLICTIGVTIGSIAVYYLVKSLGRSFVDKMIDIDQYEKKWKFLGNAKRMEVLIFSITLIPGIPKDFIAFLVPFTRVKLRRFLVINAIARIPSILSSTYFGSSILRGHFKLALLIFGAQAVVAAIGIIFNKQIVERLERKSAVKEY